MISSWVSSIRTVFIRTVFVSSFASSSSRFGASHAPPMTPWTVAVSNPHTYSSSLNAFAVCRGLSLLVNRKPASIVCESCFTSTRCLGGGRFSYAHPSCQPPFDIEKENFAVMFSILRGCRQEHDPASPSAPGFSKRASCPSSPRRLRGIRKRFPLDIPRYSMYNINA